MASTAPITAAPSGELNYKINGVDYATDRNADYYIEAAHAVAYLGEAATLREDPLSPQMQRGGFWAIQLLLAHAYGLVQDQA